MSEQEMQFASPDWQPGQSGSADQTPQPVNATANGAGTVRRSPPSVQTVPPQNAAERGYSGYAGIDIHEAADREQYAASQQKVFLRPKQRRHPWLWLVIAVAAFLLIIGMSQGFVNTRNYGQQAAPAPYMHHFPKFRGDEDSGQKFTVGSNPTINVSDPAGSITVTTGGPSNMVIVQSATSDNIPIGGVPQMQASQSQDGSITVAVPGNSADPFSSLDVNLIVPSDANLVLHTDSGDINISNVSGQLTLASGSGSITLSDVTLTGRSSIQSDSGDIDFFGALDPNGNYLLASKTGSISAGLQSGESYRLHVLSQSGTFNANFPLPASSSGDQGVNIQTVVGNNASAQLTLQTQTGDITLRS